MDLGTFVNSNWQTLGGILTFVFLAGIFYNKSNNDYREFNQRLKEQKEAHDQKIADMQVKIATLETKVEEMKDKTFEVISAMQQDIREIMTILKRDK